MHDTLQVGIFRLLVERHGANLETLTTNKNGLLHVACEAGALDIAKLLLEDHGCVLRVHSCSVSVVVVVVVFIGGGGGRCCFFGWW